MKYFYFQKKNLIENSNKMNEESLLLTVKLVAFCLHPDRYTEQRTHVFKTIILTN